MMNDNKRLLKYLNVLHKSSKEFNLKMEKIRNKYFKSGEPTEKALKNEHVDDLKPIMEDFFIPVTESAVEVVAAHMVNNEPYEKYRVHYVFDEADLGDKEWFSTPSILVELLDEMSKKEWDEIWEKRIKKNHKEQIIENEGDSVRSLRSEVSVYRKYSTFDEMLEVYRKVQKKGGIGVVYKEINDKKADELRNGKSASFKVASDRKSLEKMVRTIKGLVKDL